MMTSAVPIKTSCCSDKRAPNLFAAVPNSSVFTHLEPIEDPASFADVRLERTDDSARRETS